MKVGNKAGLILTANLGLLLWCSLAIAQATGLISGSVVDEAGAAVAGAKVTIIDASGL